MLQGRERVGTSADDFGHIYRTCCEQIVIAAVGIGIAVAVEQKKNAELFYPIQHLFLYEPGRSGAEPECCRIPVQSVELKIVIVVVKAGVIVEEAEVFEFIVDVKIIIIIFRLSASGSLF